MHANKFKDLQRKQTHAIAKSKTHICGRLLFSDAVRAGLAGVHEERHVGEAVAVVGVAAASDALVHEELDLLLDLREELINVKSIGFGCTMYPTG